MPSVLRTEPEIRPLEAKFPPHRFQTANALVLSKPRWSGIVFKRDALNAIEEKDVKPKC